MKLSSLLNVKFVAASTVLVAALAVASVLLLSVAKEKLGRVIGYTARSTMIELRPEFQSVRDAINQNAVELTSLRLDLAKAMEDKKASDSRRVLEARASVLAPNFNERELSLLSNEELRSTPASFSTIKVPLWRVPFPNFVKSNEISSQPVPYVYLDHAGGEIKLDETLPDLKLDIEDTQKTLQPVVTAILPDGMNEPDVFLYFEFDTTLEFHSPNAWRYPTLLPTFERQDLTSRNGVNFRAFQTTSRGVDGRSKSFKVPFRLSAMRLPNDPAQLTFEELQRQSRALALGLGTSAAIGEVFSYAKYTYLWAGDEFPRGALDTFTAGLGECGHINDLVGTILELNGIRYRGVSGFNPLYRVVFPGGGHSSIEVFDDQRQKWRYVDSYLDVLSDDGIESFDSNQAGSLPVYSADERYLNTVLDKKNVLLRDLFKYRRYFDKRDRLPLMNMFEVYGREDEYGKAWDMELAPAFDYGQLFNGQQKIFVRSRYVIAPGAQFTGITQAAVPVRNGETYRASRWVVKELSLDTSLVHG